MPGNQYYIDMQGTFLSTSQLKNLVRNLYMWREDWCFCDSYKFEQGYSFEGVIEKQTTAIY